MTYVALESCYIKQADTHNVSILEGLSRGYKGFPQTPATTITHARNNLMTLAIEPRLILQPTNTGTWSSLSRDSRFISTGNPFSTNSRVLNESDVELQEHLVAAMRVDGQ
jgi:hypothetical protein